MWRVHITYPTLCLYDLSLLSESGKHKTGEARSFPCLTGKIPSKRSTIFLSARKRSGCSQPVSRREVGHTKRLICTSLTTFGIVPFWRVHITYRTSCLYTPPAEKSGTYKTGTARFLSWPSGKSPSKNQAHACSLGSGKKWFDSAIAGRDPHAFSPARW